MRPARQGQPPNIVMVLDESKLDITAAPGVKVPPNYSRISQSFDGKTRSLVVEGRAATWYTEYNVLTGCRRVLWTAELLRHPDRCGPCRTGLPQALRRCGYKTITLYPAYGAFLNARPLPGHQGVQSDLLIPTR